MNILKKPIIGKVKKSECGHLARTVRAKQER